MPTGLQDWWMRSNINIIAQDVAELVQRPKYGKAQLKNIVGILCPAGEQTTIAEIKGRGVIYSGHITIVGGPGTEEDRIHIYIEDEYVNWYSYESMLRLQSNRPWNGYVYIQVFDAENFHYVAGIQQGITFEEHFRIDYENKDDNDQQVGGDLGYALI